MSDHCSNVADPEQPAAADQAEGDALRSVLEAKSLIVLLAIHVDCIANLCSAHDSISMNTFLEVLDNCMLGFTRRGHDQAAVRDALEYMVAPLLAVYQQRVAYLAGRLSAEHQSGNV
jgi:hypothetical protein